MLRSGAKGKTHAERLDNFYSGQAKGYDDFRKRLLKGREELWAALANPEVGGGVPEGGIWVDFGGGTGANLERLRKKIARSLRKSTLLTWLSRCSKFAMNALPTSSPTKTETQTAVPQRRTRRFGLPTKDTLTSLRFRTR